MNYKDDLFSDSNIFYRSSLPFSPLSPLKQTEYTRLRQNSGDQRLRTRFNPSSHPTSNHPTSSRQPKPKKVITHIEENYQITNFRPQQDYVSILGDQLYDTVNNLKIFSQEEIRDKYQELRGRLSDDSRVKRAMAERKDNPCLDWKTLKMGNLLSMGVLSEEEETNSLVRPADYIDNKYTVYLSAASSGYLQYILKHVLYTYSSLDLLVFLQNHTSTLPTISSSASLHSFPHLNQQDYTDKDKLLANINSIQQKESPIQLFIALNTVKSHSTNREESQLQYMSFYVTLALNTLYSHKRSTLIIKVYETFLPKTNELLFILYNCFDYLTVTKPQTTSRFQTQKYIICQSYRPDTAAIYAKTLLKHYSLFNPPSPQIGQSIININWLTQDVYFIQGIIKPINQYLISHFNEQILNYFYDPTQLDNYDYAKNITKIIIKNHQLWKLPIDIQQITANLNAENQNQQSNQGELPNQNNFLNNPNENNPNQQEQIKFQFKKSNFNNNLQNISLESHYTQLQQTNSLYNNLSQAPKNLNNQVFKKKQAKEVINFDINSVLPGMKQDQRKMNNKDDISQDKQQKKILNKDDLKQFFKQNKRR